MSGARGSVGWAPFDALVPVHTGRVDGDVHTC